jgi:uncharacterized membrane protein
MKRDWWPYLLILFVALFAVHPLIVHGASCGHDFDFHIVSWFEAAHQLQHGTLEPHWAFTPAWNAGEPRFVFYPPLSWYIGAVLGLVLPWTAVPIVYTWLALSAAGVSLYYSAQRLEASPQAALIAASVYIVNPYTLFTAYERTAYAELLAAAWIPLLLVAILEKRVTIARIAIPIGLLWLTNAPAAVMSCYVLAVLTLVRVVATKGERLQIAANSLAATLIGIAIAGIYLVPALYERAWVQLRMATITDMNFANNFLFGHTADADHDQVLRTASVVAVILIVAAALASIVAYMRSTRAEDRERIMALGVVSVVIVFLLTPLSAPVWRHVPELVFLQFPWRFLAILAPGVALTIAFALSQFTLRPTTGRVSVLVVAIALTIPEWHSFRQACDAEDTVASRLAVFRSSDPGTDPTDEYTPKGADNDVLKHTNPSWWLARSPGGKPADDDVRTVCDNGCEGLPIPRTGSAPYALDLNLPAPMVLVLNLRDYPEWEVTRRGADSEKLEHPTHLHREDGLLALPLRAGPSHVVIRYVGGYDNVLGWVLSIFGLVFLTLAVLHERHLRLNGQAG